MLKISRAALLAAALGLSVAPSYALAEDAMSASMSLDMSMAPDASSMDMSMSPDASSMEMSSEAPADTTTTSFASSVSVPTITAVGSSMDEAALRDIFNGNFLKRTNDLATLNATSISIPEITVSVTSDGKTSSFSIKDLMLSDVKDGVAASASIGSMTGTEDGAASFSYGKTEYSSFDMASILGFVGLVPGDASQPMKPLFVRNGKGGTFTDNGFSCTIGDFTGLGVSARPVKVPFGDFMGAMHKMNETQGKPPGEAVVTIVTYITDLLRAFATEPGTIGAISCTSTGGDAPMSFSLGGAESTGYQNAVLPQVVLHNLTVDGGGLGKFSLDQATLKATDLNPPLDAIAAAGPAIDDKWFETNGRLMVPSWGGLSFSGLSVVAPNPIQAGSQVSLKVAGFDLTMSDYLNGLPTKFSSKGTGIEAPLPQDTTDPDLQMLMALGITQINLDYELSGAWDKASQTINVDKVAISGKDLASAALSVVIGNAPDKLFGLDEAAAQAAGMNLTVKSIKLDLKDLGVADKFLGLMAASENADPAAYRTVVAGQSEGAVIAAFGGTDGAHQLGAAISDFIKGAKKALTINVTSKDPSGTPAGSLEQALEKSSDPINFAMGLSSQLDVSGSAE